MIAQKKLENLVNLFNCKGL